jgi:hypothetical protein
VKITITYCLTAPCAVQPRATASYSSDTTKQRFPAPAGASGPRADHVRTGISLVIVARSPASLLPPVVTLPSVGEDVTVRLDDRDIIRLDRVLESD